MTRKVATTDELFTPGYRRGAASALRIHQAYVAVFTMIKPTREDLDLVMGDLAEFSGYFAVPETPSDVELRELNGSRKVFARILSLIEIPVLQLNELRDAALTEMKISNEEGLR